MATIVFSTLGGAIGASIGGPAGAVIGQSVGALGGQLIDRALFAPSERSPAQSSAGDIHVQTSTEGAPILEIFGTMRIAGQVIWATPFVKHTRSSGQGKGGGSGGGSSSESYYTVSVAIALARGELRAPQRMWADGQPFETSRATWRFHSGTSDQQPDPGIERTRKYVPAYRGLAYVVFENLDLSMFGNRLPQFSFEVTRAALDTMQRVRSVSLIPAATEFGYEPREVFRILNLGGILSENRHNDLGKTDWEASLDQLAETCPNCTTVSLIVAWFGTSVSTHSCKIKPEVLVKARLNHPYQWSVGELSRSQARLVSHIDSRPAYGGSPSDRSVIAAIRDLKQRGYKVVFHPFIMMDVPPSYPWRGEISTQAALGTQSVKDEINSFFSTPPLTAFTVDRRKETVIFDTTLRRRWHFGRFILHCAFLCDLAGGVDAFLLGSELGGITRAYSAPGVYPAVDRLIELASLVKQILPNTKISYGANWDEYRGHDLGGGRFYFHLDPLWAHRDIDFVGINYYMPLADWRSGKVHKDLSAGRSTSIYDTDYLRSNIASGEGYDFYYRNRAERDQQIRTPITDSHNKPWVFRWKDISSWWRHLHYNRPDGREASTPTAWQAGMKPIWFTEAGCAAIDKGANQPNIFVDKNRPDSSVAGLPYYSSGDRDDFMQSSYLEALLTAFDETHSRHLAGFNVKIGNVRMVDVENISIWCWDARPYPYFPDKLDIWTDGVNWGQGHWITGRPAFASVSDTVKQIMERHNFQDYDISDLRFSLKGFRIDRIGAARDAFEALMRFYFFDAVERDGKIHFIHRDKEPIAEITAEECVIQENGEPGYQLIRAQEAELPKSVKLLHILDIKDYRQAVAEARRQTGASAYVAEASLPIVASQAEALMAAQSWLHETLVARERAILHLPPSRLALDPGDVIVFVSTDGQRRKMRILSIRDEGVRIVEAVAVDPNVYRRGPISDIYKSPPPRTTMLPERDLSTDPELMPQPVYGPPYVEMMDLPHLRGDETLAPHIAIHAQPRPDVFAVYRSLNGQYGWQHNATIDAQAVIGIITSPPASGREACWDHANSFHVRMLAGELMSRSEQDVLAGANYAAIKHQNEKWEIIQFRHATLVQGEESDAIYYQISGLLRGLAGTESEMRASFDSDAPFILLDGNNIPQLNLTPVERNVPYHWRIGAASQPYNSVAYQPLEYVYRGVNLRPLSPVRARAQRRANGDIALDWIRRTRSVINDGWGEQDVTLGEEYESYEIDILKAGEVIRTLNAAQPRALYTAAQQTQDFETKIDQLSICIYQVSAAFGRGSPRKETLNV